MSSTSLSSDVGIGDELRATPGDDGTIPGDDGSKPGDPGGVRALEYRPCGKSKPEEKKAEYVVDMLNRSSSKQSRRGVKCNLNQ
jgi:hypothetical protein